MGRKRESRNLSLFGEEYVKPESRAEKRAKQNSLIEFRGIPEVMQDRWLARDSSSIKTKRHNHWGKGTHTAPCGVALGETSSTMIVELVDCVKCRDKARQWWRENITGSPRRRVDVESEEE